MQMNHDLLQKLKVAAMKNADVYLEKILTASVEHGNFGMDLLDRLHEQLPRTKCGNCGHYPGSNDQMGTRPIAPVSHFGNAS
jgi:Na+-translocating ferredoxin:NAD+ oxidoreductase RNF subunit RnfB